MNPKDQTPKDKQIVDTAKSEFLKLWNGQTVDLAVAASVESIVNASIQAYRAAHASETTSPSATKSSHGADTNRLDWLLGGRCDWKTRKQLDLSIAALSTTTE